MEIIYQFGRISGLRLNVSKSQAVWLGSKTGSNETICDDLNILWTNDTFKVLGIVFTNNLKGMVDLNYKEKILSTKRLLGSWVQRDLTPIGKITILKSLALPKFIHLFSSLPNPSKAIISELDKIFFRFIWNNKPDKIKRSTIIGSYEKGGLNMVHIPSFISYIKIKWIKRIYNNPKGSWQKLLSYIFDIREDTEGVWGLNKHKLLELRKIISNEFWKDVISAIMLLKKDNLTTSEFLQEDIRNFCNISEYSFYTKWCLQGINCVNDLINQHGNFKQFEEIQNISGCNNFLKYYQIIEKIPMDWKKRIKEFKVNNSLLDVCEDDELLIKLISNKCIKFVYEILRNKVFQSPDTRIMKWKHELGNMNEEYNHYYLFPKKCSSDTSLIYFQYRILNRILSTNTFLFRLNISETNLCTFCAVEEETLTHLFYDCVHVRNLWNEIHQWLAELLKYFLMNRSFGPVLVLNQPVRKNFNWSDFFF
ncbi:hypothetical protein FSP39_006453 [Pinctada imbricata]|uniref:Reverse transcriptase zinc-binding domain-containing protein n=1 Tax=Pinctada imbricata TaxID=66713 RepID=A0AA88XJG7_PINIB|nr:hypothetical protein FSP39_006453 [Pinctada imbricata]